MQKRRYDPYLLSKMEKFVKLAGLVTTSLACSTEKKNDINSEVAVRRCSSKSSVLKISQNSQERNLCHSLLFNNVTG